MNSYTELKSCPLCGSTGTAVLRSTIYGPRIETRDGYTGAYESTFHECVVCGLLYQNPQPDMSQYYTSGTYRDSLNMSIEDIDRDEAERAERIAASIASQNLIFDSFLDVGCSRGFLMNRVSETFGAFVAGVEPNSQWPKTKHPVARSLEAITSKYDLVTCIHTLEHVPDPVSFLKKLASLLTSDGHILIEVPCVGSKVSPFRFAHLSVFEVPSMRLAFGKAGLETDGVFLGPDLMFTGHLR